MKKKMTKTVDKDVHYYMSLNYTVTVEKIDDDGVTKYGLKIPELPGIWSSGTTLSEAYVELEDTKRLWFETCLQEGIEISEPVSDEDFSGKFILRLDPRLHMALHKSALRNRNSLNQHIKNLLEHQIDNTEIANNIKEIDRKISLLEQKINSLADVMSNYLKPTLKSVMITDRPTIAVRAADYAGYLNKSGQFQFGSIGVDATKCYAVALTSGNLIETDKE